MTLAEIVPSFYAPHAENEMYLHELADWPKLWWQEAEVSPQLASARHAQGRLLGRMEALGCALREEATLETLTQDVLKTSEIEGEKLDTDQVRSSIARRLGMDIGGNIPVDPNVEGIVEIMLDATRQYAEPLTSERLFNWHAALFPTGRSGMFRITVAGWRTGEAGPMQVVSGPIGKEVVHYEAPSHDRLELEMSQFLKWFNGPDTVDLVLKSALAHFWFVTVHPFDDGNGRIARALADLLLARSERTSQRFYSMSAQIQRERSEYYAILERSQKGTLDITAWLVWYLACFERAVAASATTLDEVLTKARFWEGHAGEFFNERQIAMINRLLNGFVGKLTTSKWATLTESSQDTAYRDITDLVARRVLAKDEAGGRSTAYHLVRT